MTERDQALARLHSDLGLKPLSKLLAKLEIFLGLAVAFAGLMMGCWGATQPLAGGLPSETVVAILLAGLSQFVLGGYLALAGSRSHLYQSNNVLVAYLAELIRQSNDKGPTS